jgi:hypothetical protein
LPRNRTRTATAVLVGLLVVLAASDVRGQTAIVVEVTTDQAILWRPGFLTVASIASAGLQFEVVARRGDWYEVILPASGSLRQSAFVHASQVRLLGDVEPPDLPLGAGLAQVPPEGTTLPMPGPRVRGFVAVNGLYQGGTSSVSSEGTFDAYLETGSFAAAHSLEARPVINLAAGVQLVGPIGVAVGVSRLTDRQRAAVTFEVPHPFFFDRPRDGAGESADLLREETVLDVSVFYTVPATDRILLTLFAGPTMLEVRHDLVSKVEYLDEYPFDEVQLRSVVTTRASARKVSVSGGVDVTFLATATVGGGVFVRFSRATIDLEHGDGTVPVTAGGVQAGAGLRLRF